MKYYLPLSCGQMPGLHLTLIFYGQFVSQVFHGFQNRCHQRRQPRAMDHHRYMDPGRGNVSFIVHKGP